MYGAYRHVGDALEQYRCMEDIQTYRGFTDVWGVQMVGKMYICKGVYTCMGHTDILGMYGAYKCTEGI